MSSPVVLGGNVLPVLGFAIMKGAPGYPQVNTSTCLAWTSRHERMMALPLLITNTAYVHRLLPGASRLTPRYTTCRQRHSAMGLRHGGSRARVERGVACRCTSPERPRSLLRAIKGQAREVCSIVSRVMTPQQAVFVWIAAIMYRMYYVAYEALGLVTIGEYLS
ncbi:hypothetical protein HaLaN_20866 [Haematococcus lacustris]|uniref:Uncharacterized protein n=1 Tax=Haematococcus lacustris TaxID=44745 RepID=A0A699ZMS8_HAELA|nr:hypothetical protein HaLaN_20866 [Haematococcus lacustris]